MERLTTDTPSGNFETMMNFVHGKDGWAHIYDADGKEVNLITWALNQCHDRGCDDFQCKTLEEYDETLSNCMVDFMDCPIAMAYCFASQAVHLRSCLKKYEDTGLEPCEYSAMRAAIYQAEESKKQLSDVVNILGCSDIEHLKDIVRAEKDGRLIVLPPIKIGDTAFFIINKRIYEGKVYFMRWEHHKSFGVRGDISADLFGGCVGARMSDFGKLVFLTREEAEAALKKMEEAGDENEKVN